jgi:type IV pili sensor histidine kinase/response regulator
MFFKKLIIATLVLACAPAFAGFQDSRSNGEIEVAYRGATLDDALQGVVPAGTSISYANPAEKSAPVTAVSKGRWDVVAIELIHSAGLHATVDAAGKVILVTGEVPTPPEQKLAAAMQPAGTTALPVPGVSAAPGYAQTFDVEANDGRLSTTIARWSKQANMQLVWEPEDVDYPVEGTGTFGTDIRSALANVFNSMSGAETPLRACIHNNQPQNLIRIIRRSQKCTEI